MTSELQTLERADRFDSLLTDLAARADGAVLLSQDRCVDRLLDLYNAAPTEVVRRMVSAMIDDIRHVSAVRAADLHAPLDELRAAVAVESAFFVPSAQPASA